MKRQLKFTSALVAAVWLAGAASAQTTIESVLEGLKSEGYTRVQIKKTFLGRTKIKAKRDGEERELVISASGNVVKDKIERDDDDDDDDDNDDDDSSDDDDSDDSSDDSSDDDDDDDDSDDDDDGDEDDDDSDDGDDSSDDDGDDDDSDDDDDDSDDD